MKKIFSLFIALVTYITVNANGVTTLVLELNDGTKSCFLFSEMPVMTMSDDNVQIASESNTIQVARTNVKRFYFTDQETAIHSVKVEDNFVFNFQDKNNIRLSGLKEGQTVYVYSMAGILAGSSKASNCGDAVISLNGLQGGTFIIKCGDKSVKIKI